MSSNVPSLEELQDKIVRKPPIDGTTCAEPLVSVVTVCFNPLKDGRKELFIKNLDSVQKQACDVEHLIIDGASTDGTLDLVRDYANQFHEIRLFSKEDSGIYEAMNRGLALARGKYITFLNTDDYYHQTEGLALSVKALEESGCSFSFAPILPTGSCFVHRLHRHPERHLHRILLFPTIPHQSMLYRRAILIELGGYDPSYRMGGDHDLTLRLIAVGHKGCFVDTAFVTFSSGGFSTQDKDLKLREKMRRVKRFHKEVFDVEFSDKETETLVRHYRYPRRYLSVYVASQRLIDRTFVGVPRSIWQRLVHSFNYWKYYLKCVLGI